ncbi:MAG: MATE family efflux transporter [Bacilli bacterium]|nr:MATE family efflux transporter [Bacilli bacterium]
MANSRVKDLTKGTPWKIILVFAIPIVISYLIQQTYNLADIWMIGNMLNETSFAAVGTTNPLTLFVLMFATGTATGFSVITTQRFGKGDMEAMKKSYITGILLSIIIGAILTVISLLVCEPMLLLVNVPKGDIKFNDAYNYLMIIFVGVIANIFYNYFASILRAVGNTKAPLLFLIICAVVNIGTNFLFLKFTNLGVKGPAIATVLSQLVSAIASFIYIQLRYPEFKISFKDLKLEKEEVKSHLKQGLPMGVQFSFLYIALIILQREVNVFGDGAISAYSATNKLDALFMQPLNAIGTAMVTFVGQNYGAKKYKRIKDGIKQIAIVQLILVVVMSVIVFLIKDNFIHIFVKNPSQETIKYAPIFMLFMSFSQFALGSIFLFRNCLQASGHSMQAMIVSIVQCVTRATFALTLPKFMGIYGVAVATPISWYISAFLFIGFTIFEIFKALPNTDEEVEVI